MSHTIRGYTEALVMVFVRQPARARVRAAEAVVRPGITSPTRSAGGPEPQRGAIHAVAEPRGRRTVVEDVPEVTAGIAAVHFHPEQL